MKIYFESLPINQILSIDNGNSIAFFNLTAWVAEMGLCTGTYLDVGFSSQWVKQLLMLVVIKTYPVCLIDL